MFFNASYAPVCRERRPQRASVSSPSGASRLSGLLLRCFFGLGVLPCDPGGQERKETR